MTTQDEARRWRLAAVLMDLDRCEHGRHSVDRCLSCPDGHSAGNLLLPSGMVIGVDVYGRKIVVPKSGRFGDPDAWIPGP